ncbi:MAG: hypothetical protein PHP23_03540 [Desulfobacterales bacterium]|nr:hypothetical protein [Desulfobacterales bacterium]MDD4073494.1 hypothetical protein [Desulfobacterales bacterium]MDD4393047.1 hypothetical protein [Desulfobacterales bacterium]
MDLKLQINSFLKEANIYKKHGLFDEAGEAYNQVFSLIKKQTHLKNKQELLDKVSLKLNELEEEQRKIRSAESHKILSEQVQNLIKDKFAFSSDKDMAELEGGIALARFGQYERAIEEFQKLLTKAAHRNEAAKNILRCHLTYASADEAVQQYLRWIESDLFEPGQLEPIRTFLQKMLDTRNLEVFLPHAGPAEGVQQPEFEAGEEADDEPIDITSISISFNNGSLKGKNVDLDISFQTGDIISFIVTSDQTELLKNLQPGERMESVKFYSPIAIFTGKAVVFTKKRIEYGPRQGHYSLDLKLTNE